MSMPVPEPTPVSRPFWDALAQHQIRVQYSPSLRRYVFYPRTLAPGTLADDLEWREIDGAGTLYTYTIARRPTGPPWAGALPQLLAVVQWDAGPRISTELVDVDPDAVRIGMRVGPVFCDLPDTGITLLKYRPA
ncbi:Zn-ribbon domain-containing OB-fold protein [Mycobacterium parmense]|uniref:Acyl dehydratase n=1 Tax=Mycobacterium parmense TaxID=185642 RepID=A0A7I7YSS8_9MYCO|nr:OB-fold domain-containing protein [Mycobacterium parmense]MCV7348732.1 OB-fold domain-containing protein [Mycobacterium parmense]ORW49613.1 acyl dehydratase [Mycobacterium parmense]BBZ44242.1 acyl dehydratase [Mycobacterium parmense]